MYKEAILDDLLCGCCLRFRFLSESLLFTPIPGLYTLMSPFMWFLGIKRSSNGNSIIGFTSKPNGNSIVGFVSKHVSLVLNPCASIYENTFPYRK